jgi:hypothetical protein
MEEGSHPDRTSDMQCYTAEHYRSERGTFWDRQYRRTRKTFRLSVALFLPSLVRTQGRLNDALKTVSFDLWPVQFALEEYRKNHDIEECLQEEIGQLHLQLDPAFSRARLAMERADVRAFWSHLLSIREWELKAIETLQSAADEQGDRQPDWLLKHLEVPTLEEKAQSVYRKAQWDLGPERRDEVEALLLNEEGRIRESVTRDNVLTAIQIIYRRYVEVYTKGITLRALETQFLTFVFATLLGVTGIIYMFDRPIAVFGPGAVVLTAPVFVLFVVLFGVLGAATSGLLSLTDVLKQPVVPDHAGYFALVVGRLVVGAAGALVLHVLLLAGVLELALNIDGQAASAALVLAFVGGFSERLFRRAIERVAGETATPTAVTSVASQD